MSLELGGLDCNVDLLDVPVLSAVACALAAGAASISADLRADAPAARQSVEPAAGGVRHFRARSAAVPFSKAVPILAHVAAQKR